MMLEDRIFFAVDPARADGDATVCTFTTACREIDAKESPTIDSIKGLPFNPMWIGVDLASNDSFTAVSTTTADSHDAVTLADIKRAIQCLDDSHRAYEREFFANMASGLFNPFNSVRVVESPLIKETRKPNRLHKKRRNQSQSYHNRIQKKWNKRFGTSIDHPIYFLDGGLFGLGHAFVMHPSTVELLRDSRVMDVRKAG